MLALLLPCACDQRDGKHLEEPVAVSSCGCMADGNNSCPCDKFIRTVPRQASRNHTMITVSCAKETGPGRAGR